MSGRPVSLVALASLLLSGAALAAPPLGALRFLPGDDAIGPAWGDQAPPDLAAGSDSLLAVWADTRADQGRYDIYGVRLDASGKPIEPVSFVIDQAEGSQTDPQVAWNGSNWLVAWLSDGELMATRVSPGGAVLDAPVQVGSPGASASIALASDGNGWAVVWAGTVAGNADTRAARIDAGGAVLDPGGVVILPEESFYRGSFALAWSGGVYLLVWPEWSSARDNDIRGHRLSATLQKLEPSPLTIGSSVNADNAPALAGNGRGFLLAWKETDRNGWVNGIDFTRVGLDGVASDPEGVPLGDRRSWGEAPDVAWDGSQWIAGYTALGTFAARIAEDGTVLDPTPIELVTASGFDTRGIALAGSPLGGVRALWQDYRSHVENDVWGGALAGDGTAEPPAAVALSQPSQTRPRMVWNGAGYTLAFVSWSSTEGRILVQRVAPDGAPVDAVPVEVARGDVVEPGLAWSGQRYLVTWRRRTGSRVEARRLAPDLRAEDAAPIDVMAGENPSSSALGDVFLVAAEVPSTIPGFRDVYTQRIEGVSGALLGARVGLLGGYAWAVSVGTVGSRWLVTWEAHGAQLEAPYTLTHAFVEADGSPGPSSGLVMSSGFGTSGSAIASHDLQGAIVYSTTRAPSFSLGEVWLIRVAADGTLPDGPAGILVSDDATGEQHAPAVAWNGTDFVTAWEDDRAVVGLPLWPRSDIYAARVDGGGTVLDLGGGFAVEQAPVPELDPAVAGSGGDTAIASVQLQGGSAGALRIGVRALATRRARRMASPILLVKEPSGGVVLSWQAEAGVQAWDVIRGDRAAVVQLPGRVDLGPVVCVANETTATQVTDVGVPVLAPGQVLFWLVRANDAIGSGSYGPSSPGIEPEPSSGDCP